MRLTDEFVDPARTHAVGEWPILGIGELGEQIWRG
jgi:hypothetical protein